MPAAPIPNALPNVKAQYEAYPFPQRNPEDERKRLHISEYDSLARINHYVFGGRQDFRHGFHALVAGVAPFPPLPMLRPGAKL